MKHALLLASLLLTVVYGKTSSQLCSGTAELSSDGNWYCSEVWAITYRNISQPGVYNQTTLVDPRTGLCAHERVRYSAEGPLTPLFGEVSMHLRGPMNITQLAVYQLPSDMHTLQKRDSVPFYNRRTAKKRESNLQARTFNTTKGCGPVTVTTTITITSCEPEQATNTPPPYTTYVGPPLPCLPSSSSTTSEYPQAHSNWTNNVYQPAAVAVEHPEAAGPTPATAPAAAKRAAADWSRVAYYTSSAPAQATGLSFLANLGDPQKSGTFDYAFGNSLSYVTENGGQVASESTPFDGTLDTSELEMAVFSDKACDQDCPYWRPEATSHYGWSGSSKAFFIEFQMDHYQNRGTDQGTISDAPAWWFLNAAIPRVLQYGNDRNNIPCSCWSTGCGEFDAFEVLGNGEERAKSTLHRQGNLQGGDSNYFRRPVGRTLKFAVIWHYPHITALVLDDDFDFSAALSDDQIQRLVQYNDDSWVHSLFAIGD